MVQKHLIHNKNNNKILKLHCHPIKTSLFYTTTTLLHLYNSELSSVLDKHAPLKSRMVTIRPAAPWFSEEIKLERCLLSYNCYQTSDV